MATSAEPDELARVARIRPAVVILALEPRRIDQDVSRRRLAGQRRDSRYSTGHGFAFQMSDAYSAMVRSLENFPEWAMFRIALRAHASGSR